MQVIGQVSHLSTALFGASQPQAQFPYHHSMQSAKQPHGSSQQHNQCSTEALGQNKADEQEHHAAHTREGQAGKGGALNAGTTQHYAKHLDGTAPPRAKSSGSSGSALALEASEDVFIAEDDEESEDGLGHSLVGALMNTLKPLVDAAKGDDEAAAAEDGAGAEPGSVRSDSDLTFRMEGGGDGLQQDQGSVSFADDEEGEGRGTESEFGFDGEWSDTDGLLAAAASLFGSERTSMMSGVVNLGTAEGSEGESVGTGGTKGEGEEGVGEERDNDGRRATGTTLDFDGSLEDIAEDDVF